MLNHKDNPIQRLEDEDRFIAKAIIGVWVFCGLGLFAMLFILDVFHP